MTWQLFPSWRFNEQVQAQMVHRGQIARCHEVDIYLRGICPYYKLATPCSNGTHRFYSIYAQNNSEAIQKAQAKLDAWFCPR